MDKTEILRRCAKNEDERLLAARILDQLDACLRKNVPTHTHFLSGGEQLVAERLLGAAGHPKSVFWGGFEGAERRVLFFLPDYLDAPPRGESSPIGGLRASFPPDAGLSHRDFLGAVLSLGITREKLGDLLVEEDCCHILLLRDVLPYLLENFEKSGRARLHLAEEDPAALTPPVPKTHTVRDTVATLRLDSVVASGFSLPRGRAAALVTSQKVTLNHAPCEKADRAVSEGDVITVRGLGKCVLREVGGTSRKGRICIVLERWL
ncbi:MAG TPA: YlmH/Sll1252 family protein [Oscillospiraceae bacterium]|nr:YlmH/Sll1252 family protein [Oscillospiraceae bacterium]